MVDDRQLWDLPPLATEFEDVVDGGHDAVDWALARLSGGISTGDLVRAAAWVALRRTPVEGRNIHGFVPHGVLAAPAVDRVASRVSVGGAERAAVGHLAYVASAVAGDLRYGPMCLRWFEPGVDPGQSPRDVFRAAAGSGETELADHAWLALAAEDVNTAEQELIRAAVGGARLQSHKLIYPAELRTWSGDAPPDVRLWRAAVRYVASYLQDPAGAARMWHRAEDATAALGSAQPPGDVEVITRLATTTAQNAALPAATLSEALVAGVAPGDVAEALALGAAARFAMTKLDNGFAAIGPIHATTGSAAVCTLVQVADDNVLRCALVDSLRDHVDLEPLALCDGLPTRAPRADALDGLHTAIAAGRSHEAVEHALGVPDADVEPAWRSVHDAVITDQWLVQHGVKQAVTLHDRYLASPHPGRAVYLAAAARTAALVIALDQPMGARIRAGVEAIKARQ